MNKTLATILVACCLTAVTATILAQDRRPDFRGKVYTEIRIDDQGIILVDSTGNETMVPGGASGSEGVIPPATPLTPSGLEYNPDDYPVKISSVRKIGQSVTIEADEHVLGEVVTVGGNATIKGLVEGSVTAPTGTVRVVRGGIVVGNIIASEVIEEQGSQVFGHVTEQDLSIPNPSRTWSSRGEDDASTSAIVGISVLSTMFIFTFAIAMLFRRPTDRFKTLYSQNILKALMVGFLAWILLLPVFLLLCITIVGIPIAVLGLPLAIIASAFLGGAAFALFLSDFVKPRNGDIEESRAKKVMVGFAIGQVPSIGFFLGLIIDSEPLAIICGIAALLLTLLVVTLGMGASILTRFGSRDYRNEKVRVSVIVSETPTV